MSKRISDVIAEQIKRSGGASYNQKEFALLAADLLDARRALVASEQRCREVEADAERYRAIRDGRWVVSPMFDETYSIYTNGRHVIAMSETLDAAIDAAIAAQRQKEGE